MGADEEGTLAALKEHRAELIEPKVAEHRGHIVKTTGDGALVEFASAVDAVRCAVAVQQAMVERNAAVPTDKRIEFRVGINVGDVILDEGDLYGDGVNVAARLEGLAEPGGIQISGTAYDQVKRKVPVVFEDLGTKQVKNVADPVRIYRVAIAPAQTGNATLPLPDRPSIAVLPFTNMSGDPEQDYFADGIAEDIITALSRFRWLFVIARNSSFAYKGKSPDIRQVGRELGVRYVLEGSVRKGGDRVRITAQLVEASTGNHLWAEKYDGALADVFDLQDKITEGVVAAVEPSIRMAEIERARRKRPDSLDAYDLYLRALPHVWAFTAPDSAKALVFLDEALRIDPSYAAAHGLAALCHSNRFIGQGGVDPADRTAALHNARTVVASLTDDANALAFAGFVLAAQARDIPAALGAVDKAVALNPNSARAHANRAVVLLQIGRDEEAIEAARRALRLSPFDPLNFGPQIVLSIANFHNGRFAEAAAEAQRTIQCNAKFPQGYVVLAASYVCLDRLADAKDVIRRLLETLPVYRMATLRLALLGGADRAEAIYAAVRQAGLPE